MNFIYGIIIGIVFYILSVLFTRHFVVKGMPKNKTKMTWEISYVLCPVLNLSVAFMEIINQMPDIDMLVSKKGGSKFYNWFVTRK